MRSIEILVAAVVGGRTILALPALLWGLMWLGVSLYAFYWAIKTILWLFSY